MLVLKYKKQQQACTWQELMYKREISNLHDLVMHYKKNGWPGFAHGAI